MSTDIHPQALIVMGVAGAGKTTVAKALADRLGWDFADGDDFHPAANVAKMHAGTPLTDEDRWPWLEAIGTWLDAQAAASRSTALACSALKYRYREVLRGHRPNVRFLFLEVPEAELRRRLAERTDHFLPASLLDSQLAALEPLRPDEPGVKVGVGVESGAESGVGGDGEEMLASVLKALGGQRGPGA